MIKILSIGAGGTKCLYSLYLLNELEKKYCKEGETLSDYFDIICGSSSGSVVACGIATKYRIDELINRFDNHAHIVFEKPGIVKKITLIIRQIFGLKIVNNLYEYMKWIFKDKTFSECANYLFVPIYNITKGHVEIATNINSKYSNIKVEDITTASCTYPLHFPIYHIHELNAYYMDGAMGCKNPCIFAIMEAYNLMNKGVIKQYALLCIDSKNTYTKAQTDISTYITKLGYILNSMNDVIFDYVEFIANITKGVYYQCSYNAINLDMDTLEEDALQDMKERGIEDANNLCNEKFYKYFFSHKKTLHIPYDRK
jgi:patatin-like phospholipase/acyl hydrolase